ncbi:MAG: DUF2817 domain-containing protein [Actinomycetia bacterium]|nr:DUF2817 domain-containing protein [Actinomycetes bacterium]
MRRILIAGIAASLCCAVPGAPTVAEPAAASAASDRRPAARAKVIGKSVRGRPIRAWHIGNRRAKRKVVVLAAMHGNELAPRRILHSLRKRRRIRRVDMWVVPTVNPDGARRHRRKNAHGVDLNRNYPVRWKDLDGRYESGPRPRSERETRVLMRFLRRVNPRYVVSFHQPLHGVDISTPKSRKLARRLARYMHLPKKAFTCSGGCHGTMTQWFNKRRRGVAVTVELGRSPSKRYLTRVAPRGLLRAVRPKRLGGFRP